jgi:hypothetical protein
MVNPYFASTAELPPRPDLDAQVQDNLALDLRVAAATLLGTQPVNVDAPPTSEPPTPEAPQADGGVA